MARPWQANRHSYMQRTCTGSDNMYWGSWPGGVSACPNNECRAWFKKCGAAAQAAPHRGAPPPPKQARETMMCVGLDDIYWGSWPGRVSACPNEECHKWFTKYGGTAAAGPPAAVAQEAPHSRAGGGGSMQPPPQQQQQMCVRPDNMYWGSWPDGLSACAYNECHTWVKKCGGASAVGSPVVAQVLVRPNTGGFPPKGEGGGTIMILIFL